MAEPRLPCNKISLAKVNHDSPLTFFDRELKIVFDIDVFASNFPKSKGYKIYEGEKADLLLIRLEDLNRCARDAFEDFLNIDKFTLESVNIGSQKKYALIYQKLKESIRLPDAYIDRMYQSKYMHHFYTTQEIQKFETKWRPSTLKGQDHIE